VLEGEGEVYEFAGGYDDWLSQRGQVKKSILAPLPAKQKEKQAEPSASLKEITQRKLSIKEEAELSRLPALIEKLENEHRKLYEILADISFYQRDPKEVAQTKGRADAVDEELLRAYQRWEYLESSKE
jgi:ATP-binding cassette subfamily F protein uup